MTQSVDQRASAAASATNEWLTAFQKALTARDADAAAALFADESYWRDIVSFTWNITTVEGGAGIADLLRATLDEVDPVGFRATEEPTEEEGVITAWIAFETKAGRGSGLLRLVGGKAFTLLTTLDELKGHEEPINGRRPNGVRHGAFRDRVTWAESRAREATEFGYTVQPEVLIIGGGQGGIALGARLRQLGVPALIVERNERPGDSWRKRYKSLALHDPVWYDHLPYIPFPANWPVFSPKDKIGDWLEMYAKVMELNYWGSTTCKSAAREGDGWAVVVDRTGEDGTAEEITLRPRQLVLALGASGLPYVPEFPGREKFRGDQHHSSAHPGPDKYKGKKAVVIGSNNSAHDICAALWEAGADVTMVQRSSTHVVRSDSLIDLGLSDLYSERAVASGMTTFKADTTFASLPFRILHTLQIPVYNAIRERDAEFYRRLEQAGFDLDFGEDDSGLFVKYLRRGSGYYIDVGASELVANGDIKLAKGQVVELTEDEAVLGDGTRLPADLVVYATGYGSMNQLASDIIGQDMADKVGKVWGLGSGTAKDPGPWEGELRNMWKPTAQECLWFHGGNLALSRYYSLYLALQLKARMEGIPTPVYKRAEVHHAE
ncbi:MAG: flavin-containing monooxygenase [Trebonia sp.]